MKTRYYMWETKTKLRAAVRQHLPQVLDVLLLQVEYSFIC
jgi:hypothetical protein